MPYKIKQKVDMRPHQVRDGVGHCAPLRMVYGDKWTEFDTLPAGVVSDPDYFEVEKFEKPEVVETKEDPKQDIVPIALVEEPTPAPIASVEVVAKPKRRGRFPSKVKR